MKKVYTLFIVMISFLASFAEEVSLITAQKTATNFYYETKGLTDQPTINLSNYLLLEKDGTNLIYIFNLEDNEGFIMISAQDNVHPVLGFSEKGKFVLSEADYPPAFISWMDTYKRQIMEAVEKDLAPSTEIKNTWEYYSEVNFNAKDNDLLVAPLLTTTWNQGCYYNGYCPYDTEGPCSRVYAGCVAVAMAQVMNYHEHPYQGVGVHFYSHPEYGTIWGHFDQATYDYDQMPNSISSTNYEVAALLADCGISVNMDYSPNGSGASSANVGDALVNFFKYDPAAEFKYREDFSDLQWETMLREQLNNALPVYYRGHGDVGGHAFVCDGYQNTNYFHFNWGWSGSYDGYFYLSSLNPGSYDFSLGQAGWFDVYPNNNPPLILHPPKNLAASININDVNLSWEAPISGNGTLLGYNIYRDGVKINSTTITNLVYSDNDLDPNTYSYVVKATYSEGESEASNSVDANVTSTTDLNPPQSLQAVVTDDIVSLSWDEPGFSYATFLGYNIYRDDVKINTSLVTGFYYPDTDLSIGIYSYKITAVYEEGESVESNQEHIAIESSNNSMIYSNQFDNLTVGTYLADNDPNWTTFSGVTANSMDPFIKDTYSCSPGNSVYINENVDLVYPVDNITTGFYELSWNMYITSGYYSGYYGIFNSNPYTGYAYEVIFNDPSNGSIYVGGQFYPFSFNKDECIEVKNLIDLNHDKAQLYINGNLIHTWPYHYKNDGTNGLNQLGGVNFYGNAPFANNYTRFYLDNYSFKEILEPIDPPTIELSPTSITETLEVDQLSSHTINIANTGDEQLDWERFFVYPENPDNTTGPYSESILQYGDGNMVACLCDNDGDMEAAIKLPALAIEPYIGMYLNRVDVYIGNCDVTDFRLIVYDMAYPGDVGPANIAIRYESHDVLPNQWNQIELDDPVYLNGKEISIGCYVEYVGGQCPIGVCDGPTELNGDWIKMGGFNWRHFSNIPGWDYNWCIKGVVQGNPVVKWLDMQPSSGSYNGGENGGHHAVINTNGLDDGNSYNAMIGFRSNDPYNVFESISVTLDVPEVVSNTHFVPVWNGNPYQPMTVIVNSAQLDGTDLQVGDEIGVFDVDGQGNEICVGVIQLESVISGSNPLSITCSTDDPSTGDQDGFIQGHEIIYRFWKASEGEEYNRITSEYNLSFDQVFNSLGTAIVTLNGIILQEQTIGLNNGWNMVSFCVTPEDSDLLNIMNPLATAGSLVKVVDETGGFIQNIPGTGWMNTIGNMANTEGYYIRVNENCGINTEGFPVPLPATIPLNTGWNIIGYPVTQNQDAVGVLQALIDDDNLVKAISENGGFIQEIPGMGLMNTIGNFVPGEGYYVKVNTNTDLIIDQNMAASDQTVIPSRAICEYFIPTQNTTYYQPMHFVLNPDPLPGLSSGDEVAVFDGDLCVGAISYIGDGPVTITGGMDDPLTSEFDGYITGNEFTIQYFDRETEQVYKLETGDVFSNHFSPLETWFGDVMLSESNTQMKLAYLDGGIPNPFSYKTTIQYGVTSCGDLLLELIDLTGRRVQVLEDSYTCAGDYEVVAEKANMKPGIYFCKMTFRNSTGIYTEVKKLVVI